VICIAPPTSKAREDAGLKSPFETVPFMLGARTMARCVTGAARQATILKSATASDIATTAYIVDMMGLTVSIPTTSTLKERAAGSTLLTLTLNMATALLRMTPLISKGY